VGRNEVNEKSSVLQNALRQNKHALKSKRRTQIRNLGGRKDAKNLTNVVKILPGKKKNERLTQQYEWPDQKEGMGGNGFSADRYRAYKSSFNKAINQLPDK